MKAPFCIAVYQAVATSMEPTDGTPQTEEELFRARARALRRKGSKGLRGWLGALIPEPLAARIAARRAERDLRAQIQRLEGLSSHLLDDVGVEKIGPSDYIVRTDDMDAVRASRLAEAGLGAGRPAAPPRQGLALATGSA
jgi:hypothetical protein